MDELTDEAPARTLVRKGTGPLKRVPRDALPEEPRRWLDSTARLPADVTWIPARAPQLTMLLVAFSVLFAFTLVAAVALPPAGIIFAFVGAVPFFTIGYLWRQQRREQATLEASPWRLGALLGRDELIWAPSLSECTLFERARLEPIVAFTPLMARSDARQVRIVQELPEEGRRVIVELHPSEVAFEGTVDELAAHLEAWRRAGAELRATRDRR
jgi:hypothetical protein